MWVCFAGIESWYFVTVIFYLRKIELKSFNIISHVTSGWCLVAVGFSSSSNKGADYPVIEQYVV